MAYDNLMVFTGNANPKLAEDVVKHLNIRLGRAIVGRFRDGEVMVELLENVRGKRRVRPAVDVRADQRQPDGNPGDGRCAQARVGRPRSPRRFRISATRARTAGRARRAWRSRRRWSPT